MKIEVGDTVYVPLFWLDPEKGRPFTVVEDRGLLGVKGERIFRVKEKDSDIEFEVSVRNILAVETAKK